MSDLEDPPIKTALFELHQALGARLVPFAGYALPIQYEGIVAEHLWTRSQAGLFDVSHMGQLIVRGGGAAEALERLMPGDFAGLKDGQLRYSLLLADDGGILDDLMVTRRGEDFYLVVNGAVKAEDVTHIRAHLPARVELETLDRQSLVALQGPAAVAALARLVPGVAELGFMKAGAFTLEDMELWISRSGYTGEDGFEISVADAQAAALVDRLLAQPEVKPAGLGARDSLRLEAGLPLYGNDITTSTNPIEAGLQFAISKRRKTELGFPAAGRIMDELMNGPRRKRVGLKLDGRAPARGGAPVFLGEREVGAITSGGFSPSLEAPIAMAYLDAAAAADGTSVEVELRGRRIPATVAPMPFMPHRYYRKDSK